MLTDTVIGRLALERCQHNLAHLCALMHLPEEPRDCEGPLSQQSAYSVIEAMNHDLQTLLAIFKSAEV